METLRAVPPFGANGSIMSGSWLISLRSIWPWNLPRERGSCRTRLAATAIVAESYPQHGCRSMAEIRTDILALEQQTEGLLEEILGTQKNPETM